MTVAEPVLYNPYLPGVREDPYPHYQRLRSEAPVHWSPIGSWIVSRYRDGEAILADRNFAVTEPSEWGAGAGLAYDDPALHQVLAGLGRMMLFRNPPDHTRLRGLVSKAFTARAIEAMRPRIRDLVAELLSRVRDSGEMDLIADLAYPLPAMVIAEMLGVPPQDRDRFRQWSRDLAPTIDPMILPEQITRAAAAIDQFSEYFRHLIAERRSEPKKDLLSAMIAAEEHGDTLSIEELIANAMLLLNAGHETTTNLIGNGVLALLRNPAELERLRVDPGLVPSAVEELLRFDSPVQMTGRRAKVDQQVGGAEVAAGQQVIVLIGAANRDPDRFADPDRLDVARSGNDHLSFGGGAHYCLGASLARAEGQIAIAALIARFPRLRLTNEALEWRETLTLRGLKSLPLELGGEAS